MFHRDAEEQAQKIANEIENQVASKDRLDLENGDEEERFAAVIRPTEHSNNSKDEFVPSSEKYVAPARRKNMMTGKLIRNSMPPSGSNTQTNNNNSGGGSGSNSGSNHSGSSSTNANHGPVSLSSQGTGGAPQPLAAQTPAQQQAQAPSQQPLPPPTTQLPSASHGGPSQKGASGAGQSSSSAASGTNSQQQQQQQRDTNTPKMISYPPMPMSMQGPPQSQSALPPQSQQTQYVLHQPPAPFAHIPK